MLRTFLRAILPKQVYNQYHGLLARTAAAWYQYPTRSLVVVGITGTSGKTTTCLLLQAILQRAGMQSAAATTAEFVIGEEHWVNDTKMTMLGRFGLQRFLQRALRAGCTHAIVETTSEGLAQNRHLGIDYDLAEFLNLSPEHIESHGSYAQYQKAKERLFHVLTFTKRKRGIPKTIVVNADDPAASMFLRHAADQYLTFSLQGKTMRGCDAVLVEDVTLESSGSRLRLIHGDEVQPVHTKLLGRMNVENCTAAAAIAVALGIPLTVIADALHEFSGVPGRLEMISEHGKTVIVDYAFHPKAMEELYAVVDQLPHKRVIHVLGATGGGRDRAKRPELGRIAAEHADFVVVTNEDPYNEDPFVIMDDVLAGVLEQEDKKLNENVFRIYDRGEAIAKGIELARTGDVVLVTGKGNEQAIVVAGGKKVRWDDREVVRRMLGGKT